MRRFIAGLVWLSLMLVLCCSLIFYAMAPGRPALGIFLAAVAILITGAVYPRFSKRAYVAAALAVSMIWNLLTYLLGWAYANPMSRPDLIGTEFFWDPEVLVAFGLSVIVVAVGIYLSVAAGSQVGRWIEIWSRARENPRFSPFAMKLLILAAFVTLIEMVGATQIGLVLDVWTLTAWMLFAVALGRLASMFLLDDTGTAQTEANRKGRG